MIPLNRVILTAVVLGALLAVLGCDDPRRSIVNRMGEKTAERNAKLEQTVWAALAAGTNDELLLWQEFSATWPQDWRALGFAWHEDQQTFKGAAEATALIEERYVFKIIVDFETQGDYMRFRFPRMRFHLYEVREVRPPPEGGKEGGFSLSFGSTNKWFGPEEWKRLRDSGWDFSKIGVNIISNAPVANIRKVLPML